MEIENIDFETFLNELNTADDNSIYTENFEEFLDNVYRMDNNLMQQQFNLIYNFNNGEHEFDYEDDDDYDDLLEMIEDDNGEQDAASPFEAQ